MLDAQGFSVTLELDSDSDKGISASDGITNVPTPTFQGTAEAGATVTVTLTPAEGTSIILDPVVAIDGNWTVTPEEDLPDDVWTVTAVAEDGEGNTSDPSASLIIEIDTAAPGKPTVALAPGMDTGTITNDRKTNKKRPTFTGTAEAGATVTATLRPAGGTSIILDPVEATDGTWTATPTEDLADGVWTVTAVAEDVAGNESEVSDELSIEIDTARPGKPTVALAPGMDTGTDTNDRKTNKKRPTFTGTAEAVAIVTVTLKPAGGTSIILDPVEATDGTWTATPTADLGDGDWTVTAVAQDVAGNESAASDELSIEIDTARPGKPTVALAPGMDTGTDTNDKKTNKKLPTFTGTAEAGATVTVTLKPAGGTSIIILDAVEATDGNWTATPTEDLGDGDWTVTAVAEDVAGNESDASDSLVITIVTTAKPQKPRLATGSDSSGGKNITRFPSPTFTGIAPNAAFAAVFRSKENGDPELLAAGLKVDEVTREWTFEVPDASQFEDGIYDITVIATDAEGFVSEESDALEITIDTSAPSRPAAPVLDASTNSGITTDTITKFLQPKFTGENAEAEARIEVFALKPGAPGPVSLGTTVANGNGQWSLEVAADKQISGGDGDYAITVKATDAAGNVSEASSPLSITIDTTPPTVSPAKLTAASDSGIKGDGITNIVKPTLEGTAAAGALVTVTLTRTGSQDAPIPLGPVTAANNGAWSVTPGSDLDGGVWDVEVVAADVAGNQRTAAAPNLEFTIRTVKPAAPSKPDLVAGRDSGESDSDDVTNVTAPSFTGTAPPGTTVEVFIKNSQGVASSLAQGVAVNLETRVWSLNMTPAQALTSDGVYEVFAQATDTEGNVSVDSAVLKVTVDTTQPRLTSIGQPATPRALPVETIAVTFDQEVFGLTLADVVLEYRSTPDRSPIRLSLGSQGTPVVKDANDPTVLLIEGLQAFTGSTGTYELRIAPTGPITDLAGNPFVPPTLPPVRWQTDVTAPQVVKFGPVTPALRNTAVGSVDLEFSEAVTEVTLSDFQLLLGGRPVELPSGTVTVGGTGRNWSINGLGGLTSQDGSYTLRLVAAGSRIADSVGNQLSFDAEVSWTRDARTPTGGFLPVVSPVGAGIDAVVLEFDKPVTGLGLGDFTLTHKDKKGENKIVPLGLADLSPAAGPAARYVLRGLRQLTGVDGDYQVSVNVGGGTPVQDEVRNKVGSVTPLAWTVDTLVPVATWSGVPAVTQTPVETATLEFELVIKPVKPDDPVVRVPVSVIGVDPSDLLLTRVWPDGTIESLTGFTVSGGDTTWTVNLGSLANDDGTYRLRLVAGGSGIERSVAPSNPLREDATVEWIQDINAPTVVLSQLSWNGDRTFRVRAVFSERVTGLMAANLAVSGGEASNLVEIGSSGRDYRFDVTLPAAPANPATVTVPIGIVIDAAGNPNTASDPLRLVTDFTAPRVTLTGPAVTNASPFQVIATFTEPVTGLAPADFTNTIANGTVTSVTPASGPSTTFTITVEPAADGLVTLSLPAGAAADASDNGSAPSNSLQVRYDFVPPGVTLASLSGDPSRAQELRVAVTFNEPVTGLAVADFTVTNGTDPRLSGSSRDYVLFVTPNLDPNPDGIDVEIELAAGAATDAAGNLSQAAPSPLVIRSDRVAPVVAMAWTGAGVIEITSSETVSGLDLTDFTLTRDGQVVSLRAAALQETNLGITWELDILNELAEAGPGRYELRLVAARSNVVDDAGNPLATDAVVAFVIDGEAPVAAWIGIPPLTRTPLVTATLQFSEPVNGLSPADIQLRHNGSVVIGTITMAPAQGPSAAYEVRGLGSLTGVGGTYELRLVASANITDEAGNPVAADAVATWTLDATPPQASFGPVNPSPRLPAVFSTDIFFSEPVVGFDVGDLQLVRDGVAMRLAGARIIPIGTSNTQYRISNLSQLTRLAGDYTLTLRTAGSFVTDVAGNPLAGDASVSWTNSGAPVAGPLTAAFQAVTPNPRSSPVDAVAVTFSAVVTGVDPGDFMLERTTGGVTTRLTGFRVAGTGLRRTVEGLLPLTDAPGDYTLRLRAAGSGIASVSGQPLTADLVAAWTRRPGPAVAPAVTITPDPVSAPGRAVDAVTLTFNTPVTGVRLGALRLTRDGIPLGLTGTVLTGSGQTYRLRGLAPIAAAVGDYELRLVAAGSGITDAAGSPLAADGVASWNVDFARVRASFLAVETSRTAPLAGVRLRFSEPVLGVDVKDFELTHDGAQVPLFGVTVLGRATSWVIGNLAATQTAPGTYTLRLRAAGSGIVSPLGEDATVTWQVG